MQSNPPIDATFDDRLAAQFDGLSATEQRVARYFRENREEVLHASASALAARVGTSDATVVRTAKALGYAGMEALRRDLATDLRRDLSPAARLTRTLETVNDSLQSAFDLTLDIHVAALENLRRDVPSALFAETIERMTAATRLFIFGIGPSSAMADYLAIQLNRMAVDATALTQTGLLLADGMHRMRQGDVLILLAYGHVYRELAALLDHAEHLKIDTLLITDTLGLSLGDRVDIVLPVARGRTDMLSMHTATLGLIEALLVGIAAKRPAATLASLEELNVLRAKLVGRTVDLPTP